jgi:GWxTD domain-containing protein
MKTKIILIVIASLGLAVGQGKTDDSSLTILANYATFYIPDDSTTYIEFYYSLYRHELGFVGSEEKDHRYAGVLVTAGLFDENGGEAGYTSSYFLSQVKDEAEKAQTGVRLFDYLPMKASPGKFRAELSVMDDVSKATGDVSILVTVPDYSGGRLTSSDLELAYDIRELSDDSSEAVNTRLVKEGRLVVPNPTGVYDPEVDSIIYVYSELYGLTPSGAEDDGFWVKYSVKDPGGNLVHDFGRKFHRKPGGSAVLANALDISSLKPNEYFLILEAEDPAGGERAIATRRFALYGAEALANTISEEDVQLMLDIAWYHLSEAEKMKINDLSRIGKTNMLRQFWRDKDDDPSNPENPVYDDAVWRFQYANENFSTPNNKGPNGWRTDRGRVYIMYGPYNEREEKDIEGKTYPFVKWTYYHLEGGSIFVFVNDFVAGAVDYRLVHSTHPREIYQPGWQSVLEGPDEQDDSWKDAGDPDY